MKHKPFNQHFWITLAVVLFTGGLMLGKAHSLNEALDIQNASLAAQASAALQRVELQHIDIEVRELLGETLEDDFSEVDVLFEDL